MSNLLSDDLTNLVHKVKLVVNNSLKKYKDQLVELDDKKKEVYDLERKIARYGGKSAQKKLNDNSKKLTSEFNMMDFEIQSAIFNNIKNIFNEDLFKDISVSSQLLAYIETSDDSLKDSVNKIALNYASKFGSKIGLKDIENRVEIYYLDDAGKKRKRTVKTDDYKTDREIFEILRSKPSMLIPGYNQNTRVVSSSNSKEFITSRSFNPLLLSRIKTLQPENNSSSRIAQKLTYACLTDYGILGDFAAAKLVDSNIHKMYANADLVEGLFPEIVEIDYKGFPSKGSLSYKKVASNHLKQMLAIANFYKKNKEIPVSDEHQKILNSGIYIDVLARHRKSPQEIQLIDKDTFNITNTAIGHTDYYEIMRIKRDFKKYSQRNLDKIAPEIMKIWDKGLNEALKLREFYY